MNDLTHLDLPPDVMERAWETRDPGYDGLFVYGVHTTGIYCRPSCSARQKRENVSFYATQEAARSAGYRPCQRCQPELAPGQAPEWAAKLMERVIADPDARLKADDLRALGLAPEKVRRWFQAHYGMSFAAWARGVRLSQAMRALRNGESLDKVTFEHGYDSASGFRAAFSNAFGNSPGKAADAGLRSQVIPTPLGPMLACAGDEGVTFLEFTDRAAMPASCEAMKKRLGQTVLPGPHPVLERLEAELTAYFEGKLRAFTVPLVYTGTPFQERVWKRLLGISSGVTMTYSELAKDLGMPAARRAVARAVGTNRLYLLVPCHRIIGSDGALRGYGAGLWRKEALLKLERAR